MPNYTFLHTLAYECFSNFTASSSKKLRPRSVQCIFLGYAHQYKGYPGFDPQTGKIYTSRHVCFHETVFPYQTLVASSPSSLHDHSRLVEDILSLTSSTALPPGFVSSLHVVSHLSPLFPQAPRSPLVLPVLLPLHRVQRVRVYSCAMSSPALPPLPGCDLCHVSRCSDCVLPLPSVLSPALSPPMPEMSNLIGSPPSTCSILGQDMHAPVASSSLPSTSNVHPMLTRSKSGIHKPKHVPSLNGGSVESKPASFREAYGRPQWKVAMTDEYEALISNDTWDLVPPNPCQNPVAS